MRYENNVADFNRFCSEKSPASELDAFIANQPAGFTINSDGWSGFRLIDIAAQYDRADLIEVLLGHGATIGPFRELGKSTLHVATAFNSINAARRLLELTPNPLLLVRMCSQYPFMQTYGWNSSIDFLDDSSATRTTPLSGAIENASLEMVELLIEHGALDARSSDMLAQDCTRLPDEQKQSLFNDIQLDKMAKCLRRKTSTKNVATIAFDAQNPCLEGLKSYAPILANKIKSDPSYENRNCFDVKIKYTQQHILNLENIYVLLNSGKHFQYYSTLLNQIDRQAKTKLPNELLKYIALHALDLANHPQTLPFIQPALDIAWERGDKPGIERLLKQTRIRENPPARTAANVSLDAKTSQEIGKRLFDKIDKHSWSTVVKGKEPEDKKTGPSIKK